MNICVTSKGQTLDSPVDPRFGRCDYFIFIDTETLTFKSVDNPYAEHFGGAGVQAGQFMALKGVKAVLTGNIGPNAFEILNKAGIEIITGFSGTVKGAVENFKKGKLEKSKKPSVSAKHGMRER